MNQEVLAKGAISLKEYKTFTKYHIRKRETILFIFYLALLFIPSYVVLKDYTPSATIFSILFSVMLLSLLIFAIRLIIMRFAVKEYKSEPNAKGETTYIFSAEGIRLKSERSDTLYKWEDIKRATQKKEMLILYVTTIKAIVLPKRFFKTEKDIELFKGIVLENIDVIKIKF